jgi:type II secretory pathway component PulJ
VAARFHAIVDGRSELLRPGPEKHGPAVHTCLFITMNTPRPTCGSRDGFTLMELVLAMGVCVIVLTAINAVFFTALHLRESTVRAVDESLPVQQMLATLRRDLQNAVPPSTNGVLSGDFKVGDVSSLGMNQNVAIEMNATTGALHEYEPWADIQRVTYQLRNPAVRATDAGKDLIRSVTRDLLATITPTPNDQWMMGNVESMTFECYDGSQWRTTWDTTLGDDSLPVAVRVRIQLAGNNSGSRQPIEIIVPLNSQSQTNQLQTAGS